LELRFNEACRLLRESNLSISEISYRSGFESSAYFATAFKRKYAMSPREYRKIENAGNKKASCR
jgi:AraC-like DNA-binding protein